MALGCGSNNNVKVEHFAEGKLKLSENRSDWPEICPVKYEADLLAQSTLPMPKMVSNTSIFVCPIEQKIMGAESFQLNSLLMLIALTP